MDQAPIDWDVFREASRSGHLLELLMKLPRERWAEQDEYGNTLLHCACVGPNTAAAVVLLQSGLVCMNARNKTGNTPAHRTAAWLQPRVLEVLCAVGADLRVRDNIGHAPIDRALAFSRLYDALAVRALVANGVRLSTARKDYRNAITPELEAFERGVLRCRSAVAALLRVKRAGRLWQWDKFLLRELAYAVWATRYEEEWQN